MSLSNPPFVLHEYKHQHPQRDEPDAASHRERPRLPPIPDLRFELTYLKSIHPFVHIRRKYKESVEEDEFDRSKASGDIAESVEVEWKRVVWITLRDQVISPLFQGAVWRVIWALVSFYLSPFSSRVGQDLVASRNALIRKKEGLGIGWLREWVHGLGLTSSSRSSR
ncbi:hypothetical protein D9757_011409 [Collybiopsis confluens]|uniref:Uncharacterized protein n=1 Tax=Collybiopsis confluens TaxID=2823264 RepID=A0A8H5G8F5_9AGAR|nr:hypothetical protein D9757_011409 [Collybiopsis confluens]